MKHFIKSLSAVLSCVACAFCASAGTYDSTEYWNILGSTSVGKTFTFTVPEEEEGYYKLTGVTSGNEYTVTATGSNTFVEVLYVYKYTDRYTGGSDTYIENDCLGYDGTEETDSVSTWYVDELSWDEIVEDPTSETGAKVKPTAYYIHFYGDVGETISVTSSKGLVTPPKSGTLTVRIKGSDAATWSLKGQSGAYTNGQTIAIFGQQTVQFSTVKGLTKPADKTVTPLEEGEEIEVSGTYGVKLTLKGTGVTAEYEGTEYTGSLTVAPGDEVVLRASDSESLIFQSWTPSKAYDFGADYSAVSSETTIVMPSAALTMTANYLKVAEIAYLTMYADPVVFAIDEETTVEPADGDLLWSTDGKTWYECNRMGAEEATKVLVKKGSYTVQWKSKSGSWEGPAKSKVTLKAGDDYSNSGNPAVFTFVMVLKPMSVVYANGEIAESAAGGTIAMKPADGRIAAKGTTFTLTAKANKDYAFVGWQFGKLWEEEGEFVAHGSATTTFTFSSGVLLPNLDAEDFTIHFYGVFRAISDYGEGTPRAIGAIRDLAGQEVVPDYDEEGFNGTAEFRLAMDVTANCYFDMSAEALPTTLKLTGTLPKGLKFDAKTGLLSGKPTVAGTYPLTLTATDPAGNVCTLEISLVVYSAFESVVGDWRALLTDENGIYAGLLEMSVTDRGKVSAKVITASGTTSCATTATPDGDRAYVEYSKATGNAKSGSLLYLSVGAAGENEVEFFSQTWKNGVTNTVSLSGAPYRGDSAMLKDSTFAATFLGKYFTVALTADDGELVDGYRTPIELAAPGYLTLTTDKKGTAKVAGKLADGEKISASALLLPWSDGSGASALVFVVPSGYKKKGSVALQLDLYDDGNVYSSIGSWTTPPLLDAITGYTPEEEEDEFLPGFLALSADGAVYSALSDLTDYYLALSVEAGLVLPALEYSYTDETKQKVYETAEAVPLEYALDSDSGMLTGGKGGKITVAKSPTPWKDGDEWNYDESKSGEEITNPGSLTISFKPATGIFSGKFNLFFDYEVPTKWDDGEAIAWKQEHKSVSCSYEGVLVRGEKEVGTGSAVYSGKYTYAYTTAAGKAATKTYTKKTALKVDWNLE